MVNNDSDDSVHARNERNKQSQMLNIANRIYSQPQQANTFQYKQHAQPLPTNASIEPHGMNLKGPSFIDNTTTANNNDNDNRNHINNFNQNMSSNQNKGDDNGHYGQIQNINIQNDAGMFNGMMGNNEPIKDE